MLRTSDTETLIHDPESGIWFAWNRAHTVNVRYAPDGQDFDCYTIGDFALPAATYESFERSVAEYIAEEIGPPGSS